MSWFSKNNASVTKPIESALPPATRVSDFLSKEKILLLPANLPKRDLFLELMKIMNLPEADIAIKSVLAREQIGSTVLEKGVALPHARVPGLDRIHAALGITSLSRNQSSDEEIRICLLFVGPTSDMKGHLSFLASCAALFQDKDWLESILRLNDPANILEKIKNRELLLHDGAPL